MHSHESLPAPEPAARSTEAGITKAYDIENERYGAFRIRTMKGSTLVLKVTAEGGGMPGVEFKRESKVTLDHTGDFMAALKAKSGREGSATAKNWHGLRRHFTNL